MPPSWPCLLLNPDKTAGSCNGPGPHDKYASLCVVEGPLSTTLPQDAPYVSRFHAETPFVLETHTWIWGCQVAICKNSMWEIHEKHSVHSCSVVLGCAAVFWPRVRVEHNCVTDNDLSKSTKKLALRCNNTCLARHLCLAPGFTSTSTTLLWPACPNIAQMYHTSAGLFWIKYHARFFSALFRFVV